MPARRTPDPMRPIHRLDRQATGRLGVALLLVGLVVGMFVGPWVYRHYLTGTGAREIHDVSSLPTSVHTCGRTFARTNQPPRTFAEARGMAGTRPVLIDTLPFSHCPDDWCRGEACHTVVWVRVEKDALVAYSLRGGP